MPAKGQRTLVPFSEASKVTPRAPKIYSASLAAEWVIGSVPNGGYVASCMLRAAAMHLAQRGQPDTIAAHFEYISRTEVGPAVLIVEEVKLGRAISTVQVTLYQNDIQPEAPWVTPQSRKQIIAFITNTRISLESGLTLPTGWSLAPAPPAVDLAKLPRGEDASWAPRPRGSSMSRDSYTRVLQNIEGYTPRQGQIRRGVIDTWLRFTSGETFSDASLGYVVDAFPYAVEAWRPEPDQEQVPYKHDTVFWYPTLVLNLEVKKTLGPAGAEWLFMRCMSKVIKNGRLDLEVVILDRTGDVVALSNQTNLVLPGDRNLGARSYAKQKAQEARGKI